MAQDEFTQPIQEVISFPFKDPQWKQKILIGCALGFASFFTFNISWLFVMGYFYQIRRRIIVEGGQPYLPEWTNWGKLITDGLKVLAANLIASLPVMILSIIGAASYFGSFFWIPFNAAANPDPNASQLYMFVLFIGFLIMGIAMLASSVLGLAEAIFLPAAICQLVAVDSLKGFFQIKTWWLVMRANFIGFLASFVVMGGLVFISYFLLSFLYMTLVLCFLLPFLVVIVMFYAGLISCTLFAQAYRAGSKKLAAEPA